MSWYLLLGWCGNRIFSLRYRLLVFVPEIHDLRKNFINGKGVECINLGTGHGYSVLQVKDAFEKACGKKIAYKIMDRRPGDIATCYADTSKAKEMLGWQAEYNIEDMCKDAYHWQLNLQKKRKLL